MSERIIRSTKAITGIEPSIGSEWDAGYLPCGAAYSRVRITVKKEADAQWTVYAFGFRGGETLLTHFIAHFTCETCAKAFALCLVFGSDYATCEIHGRQFSSNDIFEGTLIIMRAAMGICDEAWHAIDEGSRHRVLWVVRQILDGQLQWERAINAWGFTENSALPPNLNTLIRFWHAELMLSR